MFAVAGMATLALVSGAHDVAGTASKPETATSVVTAKATRGLFRARVEAIGTVQPLNQVSVKARMDGLVTAIRFVEGRTVHRGDVLADLDSRPSKVQLRAALAQRERDSVQLPAAERNVARYQDLLAHGAVTPQMVDAARATRDQLRAAVAVDEAQVDQARLQLDYATIRAPIDGRAGARLVDAGNLVHAGDSGGIVTLIQMQPIAVSFALPQGMLLALSRRQARQPLTVRVQADGSLAFEEGKLTLIDSQVDPTTGTVRCKATFSNRDEALWPGSFVNVHVQLDTLEDAVTVPTAALQTGQQGSYVYVVGTDQRAQRVPVTVGPASDGRTVVRSGLRGGEQVIVEGQFRVDSGALVAPSWAAVAAAR